MLCTIGPWCNHRCKSIQFTPKKQRCNVFFFFFFLFLQPSDLPAKYVSNTAFSSVASSLLCNRTPEEGKSSEERKQKHLTLEQNTCLLQLMEVWLWGVLKLRFLYDLIRTVAPKTFIFQQTSTEIGLQMNICKIIYLNCGEIYEFTIDRGSYTHMDFKYTHDFLDY